ncbi:thymidine phosphorylase [Mycobacterium sp. Y57]|uniref:thymidine phosphorylase n=1 Tax=Mycolicibacterium xanthum TaxID=2796469 RepID=UPI001C85AC67|nr:thymidine phosphorylase [Mycolicibacterium xanthum]MBX7433025.1 thymidine phosphorylase [Mycolicibacterium xanthum]
MTSDVPSSFDVPSSSDAPGSTVASFDAPGPGVASFDAPTVIRTKRDGGVLSDAAIDWVIDAYTHGRVADAQMSALLMAIFLKGMTTAEIARWTAAMVDSGERMDFTDLRRDGRPLALVDKHSTGGVGDKITIPLVPVVMACGGAVPQAAGRGLGHTGGTLDKLESIPGFTAEISQAQIRQQLRDLGAAIFAAGELAPADRKIYALRDVTGTTESLPLIASSVMSKKIAEGTRALVLDTKVGSGAFLATEAESRELARTMVDLGTEHGLDTRALLTDMNVPLGRTVGNSVEVVESLEVLAGGGPADVVELTLALAREMLDAAGLDAVDPAQTLRDGSAMDRFRDLVAAQGGDVAALSADGLPLGAHSETISAPRGGTMGDIDAMAVGLAVWRLGAGRSAPGERVQFGAGLRIHRRPGEPVAAGEPLFTLYSDTPERFGAALSELDGAYDVGDAAPAERPLIIDRIV